MARNVSGTHSLPAGNPVTTGTTIDSTWANTTLDDLSDEITDSLSRSGKGGMTAPIRCADGDVSAPAFSFTSETGTGWYRSAAGVLRAAILGTYRLLLNATGLQVNGTLQSSGKIIGSAGLDITGQVAVVDDGGTSKKVTVDAPTGLAADYALVLPTGLPGSTLPVTLTSAGVLSTAQLVNSQQNFGTPSAATDVAIKSYVDATFDGSASFSANVSASSTFTISKRQSLVTITGIISISGGSFAGGATLVTMSAGFRPAALGLTISTLGVVHRGVTGSGLCLVKVTTGGVLSVTWATQAWDGSMANLLPLVNNDGIEVHIEYYV